MKKLQQILFLFVCFSGSAFATGDSLSYLTLQDTIFLKTGDFGEKYFEHTVEKKQTLYSLAKFYGMKLEEVYFYNPSLKGGYHSGDIVKIPIPNRCILRYKTEDYIKEEFIPIYYVVKKGDTLYGISKRVFKMPMDTITNRNPFILHGLSPGQKLQVGWMSIKGIPQSYRQEGGGILGQINRKYRTRFLGETFTKRTIDHQGISSWKKNSSIQSDFYALHRHAKKGDIIAVTNPMKNRTVYLKVSGKIPETLYGNEVAVVISPFAAKLLGARDPKFFVTVK